MPNNSVDDSFARAAMAGLKGPTPLARRTRKPWIPPAPITILEFEEAKDEAQPVGDSDRRDGVDSSGEPQMAEGGELK